MVLVPRPKEITDGVNTRVDLGSFLAKIMFCWKPQFFDVFTFFFEGGFL